ncbi:hypothetical protein ABK040_011976 [Willaertia magna]
MKTSVTLRKLFTVTSVLAIGAVSLDYLLVKKYFNVNYCPENAQHDLLGTYSHRNPNEPSLCGIDHYRTFISQNKNQDGHYNINQLVNAFFSNPLFKLQTRLLDEQVLNEQQVDECKFEIGDKLSEFKVIEKNENEIMFKSNDGYLLWFKLASKNNEIQLNFGSSMLSDSPHAVLPPVIDKVILNLHFLYARYLLLFTKRKFDQKFN